MVKYPPQNYSLSCPPHAPICKALKLSKQQATTDRDKRQIHSGRDDTQLRQKQQRRSPDSHQCPGIRRNNHHLRGIHPRGRIKAMAVKLFIYRGLAGPCKAVDTDLVTRQSGHPPDVLYLQSRRTCRSISRHPSPRGQGKPLQLYCCPDRLDHPGSTSRVSSIQKLAAPPMWCRRGVPTADPFTARESTQTSHHGRVHHRR